MKKRAIFFWLVVAIAMCFFPLKAYAEDEQSVKRDVGLLFGDINGDGAINQADVDMLRTALAGSVTFTSGQKYAADVNGDKTVDETDFSIISGYIQGTLSPNIMQNSLCLVGLILGDVNKDGAINQADILIVQYLYLNDSSTDEQRYLSDINGNGEINPYDLARLQRCLLESQNTSKEVLSSGFCGAIGNERNVQWTLYKDGLLIISGAGLMADYSSYETTPWFEKSQAVFSVVVEEGVLNVGSNAFYQHTNLKSAFVSVEEIGDSAFSGCVKLNGVTLPSGLQSVGSWAFSDCDALTNVVFPEGLKNLSEWAFHDCDALTSIALPSGLETLGEWAFDDCGALSGVTIPGSVDVIERYAFHSCDSLAAVVIEDGVKGIGEYAFGYCGSLASLSMPANVSEISSSAFYECIKLSDVYYGGTENQWKSQNWSQYDFELTRATIHYSNPESNYVLSFSSNGGSGNMSPVMAKAGHVTIPSCGFTAYKGRKFKCWVIAGNEYQPGDIYNIRNDVTATAQWVLDFDEAIYRAAHLADTSRSGIAQTTEQYMYTLKTPAEILLEAGRGRGLEASLNVWNGVTIMGDFLDDPSSLLNIPVESKDIYTAIIMDILQSSVSLDYLDMRYIDGINDAASFVETARDALKAIIGLDLKEKNVSFAEIYRMLPDDKKSDFVDIVEECIQDTLEEEQPDIANLGDVFEEITGSLKLLEIASDATDYYERVLSCVMIATQCKQYADSINEAYQESLKTHNMPLRRALYDCKQMIEAENEEIISRAISAQLTSVGKKALQHIFKEVYWTDTKATILALHPAVAMFMVAYSFGKLTANALFKTDEIKKQFTTLQAVREIEELFVSVNLSMKNRFQALRTSENANAYLCSFDLVYRGFNADCVHSDKFIDTVEKADWIHGLFGSNDTYEDKKNSIRGIQANYSSSYDMVMREWINYLSEDYPDSMLEAHYRSIYQDVPYGQLTKSIDVACPVDVYVYNTTGNAVASVVGEVVSCDDNNIMIARNGYKKTICFYGSGDYRIEYVGTDVGDMDITVTEYDEEKNASRTVNFNNVELSEGTTYSLDASTDVQNTIPYELTDNKTTLTCDYDSASRETQTYRVTLDSAVLSQAGNIRYSTDAVPGERLELHAIVPAGCSFLKWEITAGNATIENVDELSTSFVMPNEDISICAVLEMPSVMIKQMDFSDSGKVTVTIHCTADNCLAFCGFYDVSGKMLNMDMMPLQMESENKLTFTAKNEYAVEVRIFILDSGFVPQCPAAVRCLG